MVNRAVMSSSKHDWQTPERVLDLVRQVGPIALDPCTTAENPCDARVCFVPPADGLALQWSWEINADGVIYVNPPYGRAIGAWVDKCVLEAGYAGQIILLVPARPDTAWYDVAKQGANALCEVRGRLRFKGADAGAPFPSALFYWGTSPFLFCHVFQELGRVEVMRQRAR
jgi:site-specific DNA-methyltransferase (adenine-specific)